MSEKMSCDECGWRGEGKDLLRAPNPFESGEVTACPECKAMDALFVACDESGCWYPVTCGTPTSGGYRRTCGRHVPRSLLADLKAGWLGVNT